MRIVALDKESKQSILNDLLKRSPNNYSQYESTVNQIIDRVRAEGDKALFDYTLQFDKFTLTAENIRVTKEEIAEAYTQMDENLIDVIRQSAENIRAFHQKQLRNSWFDAKPDGTILGMKITAIERAGVYVPGGKAAYPSSVLMNVIPAKVAGVDEIIMTTPPGKDGKVNPGTLVAADIAGVDTIYKVGGAQAIAAMAFGTQSVPKVDKITGPGNIFVATAKRMVSGIVGIDAVAGPTEIAIIADKGANPSWLAADLIGQAEHDELAGSVLITDSEEIAEQVQENLKYRVPRTEHSERVNTSLRGRQSGIILTDGIEQSIDAANAYAAEHLEVQTADPDAVIAKIRNAGAIFRGPYSPVPLGDYMSGSNHVLPTSGTARFASGLGVHTFMKPVEVIEYDEQGLKTLAARVNAFAVSEDLPAHGESVLSRFIDDPYNKETIKEQEEQAGLR